METGGEGQGGYGGFQDAGAAAPAQQGFDGGNFESSTPPQDTGVIERRFSEVDFSVNSHQEEADTGGFDFDEGQEIALDQPSNIVDFEAYKNAKEGESGEKKETEIQDQPIEHEEKMDTGHALTIAKNEGFEGALSYFATFGDKNKDSEDDDSQVEPQDQTGSTEVDLNSTETEEQPEEDLYKAESDEPEFSEDEEAAGHNLGFGYDSELMPSDKNLPEEGDESDTTEDDQDNTNEEPEEGEPVAKKEEEEEPVILDKPEIKELISALKDSNEIMKKMIERLEEQEKLNAETLLMLALLMKKLIEEKEKKDEEDKSLLATLMSVIGFLMNLFVDPEKETKKEGTEQMAHAA